MNIYVIYAEKSLFEFMKNKKNRYMAETNVTKSRFFTMSEYSKGKMGKADLLSLSLGYVIGAGIITLVGQAIGVTGRSAWLAYFIAICLGFFINIPYIFLSKTARFSGGPYNLISSLASEKLGGIYVTAFIAQCIGLSLYGVSFGVYAKSLWPNNATVVSIIFVAVIYLINLLGVGAMAKLQNIMTAILAVALLMFYYFWYSAYRSCCI